MYLIAPEVLAEARGLTDAMSGTLLVLGLALWLFGWRWHRFWIVAGITLGAGLLGLNAGRAVGGAQIMAIGILLAVSAGMLALELAKLLAFVAAGCGAWIAAQWVFPQAQELWAVFLSAGIIGLLLYRVWTMLLTSLAGVTLAGHAGVLLLEPIIGFDGEDWVNRHQVVVNSSVIGLVLVGILLQALATPELQASETDEKDEKNTDGDEKQQESRPELKAASVEARPWWRRLNPLGKAA
jgi:hypothetical protein